MATFKRIIVSRKSGRLDQRELEHGAAFAEALSLAWISNRTCILATRSRTSLCFSHRITSISLSYHRVPSPPAMLFTVGVRSATKCQKDPEDDFAVKGRSFTQKWIVAAEPGSSEK